MPTICSESLKYLPPRLLREHLLNPGLLILNPTLYAWNKSQLVMVYNSFLYIAEFGLLIFDLKCFHLCS